MYNKLLTFLCFICLFGAAKVNAQLHKASIGVSGAGNYYFGDFNKINLGINSRLTYDVGQYGSLSAGYIYGLPLSSKLLISTDKEINKPLNAPYYKVKKIEFRTLYLNYHYFIGNDNKDKFGIYLLGGANFTSVKIKQNNEITTEEGVIKSDTSLSKLNGGFGLNVGIGVQVRKGILAFFSELNAGVPINIVTKDKIEHDVAISMLGNLGVRLYFGKDPKSNRDKRRGRINPNM